MNEPGRVETVEEYRENMSQFGVYDYIVFVGMLVGCSMIGVYYACVDKNRGDSANEYLMGGRNMKTFPVAMSLVASFISGITLLGAPTEMYLYGTEYMFVFISIFLTGLVSSYLFLPVFHEMQLSSTYEYLQRRFDRNVRLFGSLLFAVTLICWLPIVIYVPALAFNQVTEVNIHIVTSSVCVICIFYTCLGGLKAVVWTDVVQTWFMVGSMILVSVKGSLDVGGFEEVWRSNFESGRIVAPTITFGGLIMWIQGSVINQNVLQRYLSLPSLSHARRALWLFVLGTSGLIFISCYSGLVIYATFKDCDPLTTKLAKAKDQLLPLLVMKVLSNLPGLPGLFVAGIFSASLSSLSTGLNSMSAVVLEDFIKPFVKRDLSPRMTGFIMRGVVLVFGALFLFLVLIVEKLGTVLQLSISLGSMTSGPVFGIFFCGIFLPWVNAKGALFGGLLGLLGSGFVVIGAQNAIAEKKLKFIPKPTSVEGCSYYYNASILSSAAEDLNAESTVFPLFKLSYFWYTAFGGLLTIILAITLSALTGFTDFRKLDPLTLSPVLRSRLPKSRSQDLKYEEQELMKTLRKDKM